MAEKRMFSNKVIETDAFLDMPDSTQNLYFHLSMNADDDGFVAKPKSIMRMTGKKEDDMRLLITKSFIIPFESGVIVIKHWRINNYLRADRYKETIYQEEKQRLSLNAKGEYELGIPVGIPVVDPNKSISNSNTNNSIYNNTSNEEKGMGKETKHKFGEYQNVLLKDSEFEKLKQEYGEEKTVKAITFLDEYIEMKGYKAKSHNLALRKWVFNAVKEQEQRERRTQDKEPKKDKAIDILQELWEEADKKEKEQNENN